MFSSGSHFWCLPGRWRDKQDRTPDHDKAGIWTSTSIWLLSPFTLWTSDLLFTSGSWHGQSDCHKLKDEFFFLNATKSYNYCDKLGRNETKQNDQKAQSSFWQQSFHSSSVSWTWTLRFSPNQQNVVDAELLQYKIYFFMLLLALWEFYYFKKLRRMGWQLPFIAKANQTTDHKYTD